MRLPLRVLVLLVFGGGMDAARAISCPSPETIRDRGVHRAYEWTVDEGISLEALLRVTQLAAVSIENIGEFVACTYHQGEGPVSLYAKPIGENCVLKRKSGSWRVESGGRLVCDDEDLYQCVFVFNCEAPGPGKAEPADGQ